MYHNVIGSGVGMPISASYVEVTGTLVPDITGFFTRNITLQNGRPSYTDSVSGYNIWWASATTRWRMTAILGNGSNERWTKSGIDGDPVDGEYSPGNGATGTATAGEVQSGLPPS